MSSLHDRIDSANREAVERMTSAQPVWIDVTPRREVLGEAGDREIFHSGPPVAWERMCGAQRGAVIGAILFEAWAKTPEEAVELAQEGAIHLSPNHHHGGVGPMAGVVSPSMPVFVIEDRRRGKRAWAALEEPRMNFGAYDEEALALRRFWREQFAPALAAVVRQAGGIDLGRLIARALHRGDEMHNRPAAATSLLIAEIAPPLLRSELPREEAARVLQYLAEDEIFFLSLSMGAAKLAADAAHGTSDSTVVTAMARNGTDFGIRVSGTGNRWFTAPSPRVQGLYLPGYGEADAGLDMGDSAITETIGLGGFVLPAAPAILQLVGGSVADAFRFSSEMKEITVGRHPLYTLPILDFEGAPVGIDIRKVVETGILPVIDTAIAHREAGHPIIGAGLTRAPRECFVAALEAFASEHGIG